MKRKVARLRLSPNEEARIIREEHERRRKLRIQQVMCDNNATSVFLLCHSFLLHVMSVISVYLTASRGITSSMIYLERLPAKPGLILYLWLLSGNSVS